MKSGLDLSSTHAGQVTLGKSKSLSRRFFIYKKGSENSVLKSTMRSESPQAPPPKKKKTKEQETSKAPQVPQNSHQAFHTLKSRKKPLHQFGARLLSISQDKAVIKIHKKNSEYSTMLCIGQSLMFREASLMSKESRPECTLNVDGHTCRAAGSRKGKGKAAALSSEGSLDMSCISTNWHPVPQQSHTYLMVCSFLVTIIGKSTSKYLFGRRPSSWRKAHRSILNAHNHCMEQALIT